jgi:ribosomal RNA assembly protein
MKDPQLRHENWERFLPKFEKKNLSKRKQPLKKKEKKPYTPFPPPMPESKVDKQLASGEYFLKPQEKRARKLREQREKQVESQVKRDEKRRKSFQPPQEAAQKSTGGKAVKNTSAAADNLSQLDVDKLAAKVKKAGKDKKKAK